MLVYGLKGQEEFVGHTNQNVECPECGVTAPWQIHRTNKKAHVYFIPVAKWDKRWIAICRHCSAGIELPTEYAADQVLTGQRHLSEVI